MATAPNTIPEQFAHPETMALQSRDMSRLRGLQWNAVYEALTMAIVGVQGVENQPRCQSRNTDLNPAGEYLDCLSEFLNLERTRLIERLHLHRPEAPQDKISRANLLIQYEAECGGLSMPELAAFALSLANETH